MKINKLLLHQSIKKRIKGLNKANKRVFADLKNRVAGNTLIRRLRDEVKTGKSNFLSGIGSFFICSSQKQKEKCPPVFLPGILTLSLLSFLMLLYTGINQTGNKLIKTANRSFLLNIDTIELTNFESSSFSDNIPRGTGLPTFELSSDLEYTVKDGETLSEIAYIYGYDSYSIAFYNKINNANSITKGQTIIIPTKENLSAYKENIRRERELVIAKRQELLRNNKTLLPPDIKITASKQSDGNVITAHFSFGDKMPDKGIYYEWHLGNGRKSFKQKPSVTYKEPGSYVVRCLVRDKFGYIKDSNRLVIEVPNFSTVNKINKRFLTLKNPDELFTVNGEITQFNDYTGRVKDFPLVPVGASHGKTTYKITANGYFHIISRGGTEKENHLYLFVSPINSVHSDRNDINWYRTQFNTGTKSNCGPSVVSMSIGWAKGIYVPVSRIRREIGWSGNGSTSFIDLKRALTKFNVNITNPPVQSVRDIIDIIDHGNIAIILYYSGGIRWAKGHPENDLFGRYYNDSVGHYIIIKGYSEDKRYFIVYDPVPSDWGSNSKRYGDGISMLGRNRYYPVNEIFNSLRRRDVIEITR